MLSASDKLRQLILFGHTEQRFLTPEKINAEFERELAVGLIYDVIGETRQGTHKTELPCESCRNYESEAVAMQMIDDSWVGWTYYHGGGKHSDPGGIPWIEDAYDLERPKEVTVTKLVFKKPRKKRGAKNGD